MTKKEKNAMLNNFANFKNLDHPNVLKVQAIYNEAGDDEQIQNIVVVEHIKGG